MTEPFLIDLDTVDGTNAEMKRWIAAHPDAIADGTVISARVQTAGVGRRGRAWSSPAGNLYWSQLRYPGPGWPPVWGLSIVAGLAVLDLVRDRVPPHVVTGLKWPNDVLVNGAKVAGILLESGASAGRPWVITGIGVNLASAPDAGMLYAATSLRAVGSTEIGRDRALADLTLRFGRRLESYLEGGLAWAREAMLANLVGIGEPITARLSDDPAQDVAGTLRGLDEHGRALIETETGGVRAISAGDLFFPGAAAPARMTTGW